VTAGGSLAERAELLGLTMRECVALTQSDRRLGMPATLWGNGAVRLRRWLAAGRPAADRAGIAYGGDPTILRAVREVLDGLPEPVAHHVVTTCVVIGVAVDSVGWCGPLPDPPCVGADLVALSVTTEGIIGHEFAHSWQRPPTSPRAPASYRERERLSEAWQTGLAATAVRNARMDVLVRMQLENELAADRAATAWGWPIDTCGERRHRAIRADICRRAAAAAEEEGPP
jgi:hypothetical protein